MTLTIIVNVPPYTPRLAETKYTDKMQDIFTIPFLQVLRIFLHIVLIPRGMKQAFPILTLFSINLRDISK